MRRLLISSPQLARAHTSSQLARGGPRDASGRLALRAFAAAAQVGDELAVDRLRSDVRKG